MASADFGERSSKDAAAGNLRPGFETTALDKDFVLQNFGVFLGLSLEPILFLLSYFPEIICLCQRRKEEGGLIASKDHGRAGRHNSECR